MKLPSIAPWDHWNRKLLLTAAGCAVAIVVFCCLLIVALSGRTDNDVLNAATAETAETAETASPENAALTRASDLAVETAAAGTVLGKTEDAGRTYVDETLFIGDSNTARYMMYADETGQAFTSLNNNIGVVSMGAGAITTLKCEKFKGSSAMYTVPDAVAMLKPKRIIICYGTNNLGGSSTDATSFISTYLQGLQAIQTSWPYCDIIVSAIPPLDKQRENTNLTMTQVDAYNAALVTMCEENGFKFLNSAEVLRDSTTGWAKTDYTLSDGVHLSKAAVTAYFDYVRTHAYVTEDRRPQPLGTIPTPRRCARQSDHPGSHRRAGRQSAAGIRGHQRRLPVRVHQPAGQEGRHRQRRDRRAQGGVCLCRMDIQHRRQLQQRHHPVYHACGRQRRRRGADRPFPGGRP